MNQVRKEDKDQIRHEMMEDDYRETQAMIAHQAKMKDDLVYLMESCGIVKASEAVDEVVKKLEDEGFLYTRKEVLEHLGEE